MQLARAVDPGMRGEDLLDERRSRPLETDDEDRPRVGFDPAASCGRTRERRNAAIIRLINQASASGSWPRPIAVKTPDCKAFAFSRCGAA